MTPKAPTTSATPANTRSKRVTFYFAGNLCVAVLMLFALPIITKGANSYRPYAKLDKDYVYAAINSGEAEFMHTALKTTETARAMAYDSQVTTLQVMQAAAVALAALFLLNSFFLFRLRRDPVRAPVAG